MRAVSAGAAGKIAQVHGTEPTNFISIQWSNDSISYYGDKAIAPSTSVKIGQSPGFTVEGRLIQLGNLDEVLKVTSGSRSTSIDVILDDNDGVLKTLWQTHDIHKATCKVYQSYDGLSTRGAFVIFQGEIVTPITWKECERQLAFSVLSEIDTEEVGFAPEEGQLDFVTDDAVGKVWPLAFGDVVHVPATKSSSVITSVTTTELGYPDATLSAKYNLVFARIIQYLYYLLYMNELLTDTESLARDPELIQAEYIATVLLEDPLKQNIEDETKELEQILNKLDNDDLTDTERAAILVERTTRQNTLDGYETQMEQIRTLYWILDYELNMVEYKYQVQEDIRNKIVEVKEQYVTDRQAFYTLATSISQQSTLNSNSVKILNGDKFPQGQEIQLTINGLVIEGTFSGDVFTVARYLPKYTNVQVGARLENDPKSFWVQSAAVDLSGYYVLTNTGYVLKVDSQAGTRCAIDLREDKIIQYEAEEEVAFEELDPAVWLQLESASEHTDAEKERILEQALGDTANGQRLIDLRSSITDRVQKLKENLSSVSRDQIATIRGVLHKDMFRYNRLISQTKVPLDAQVMVNQKISQEEEDFLLRCRNLAYLRDQRLQRPLTVSVDKSFINGYQADQGIAAASTVIFPDWLPGLDLDGAPPSTMWVAPSGTSVSMVGFRETYIANIIPSDIKAIYAERAINGKIELVPVPESYYNIVQDLEVDNLVCTGIELYQPLTSYANEGWNDGLYVSMQSSVGPNTADIIKWILENYTDVTADNLSFSSVKTKIEKYPSNFALLAKRDALQLVEDIAWQARCVVYVKNKTAYIKYLATTPSPDVQMDLTHIEEKTLTVTTTPTEDLYTVLTALWKPHYYAKEPNKTVIRHNIARYKAIEFEREFSIYNIQSLVEKSLTFWTIRYSNSWTLVNFTTFMPFVRLETWDTISLYIPDIADEPILAIVEEASYDSDRKRIQIQAWLPIRTGTRTQEPFSFPADLDAETEFPTPEDIAGGNAGNPRNYPNDASPSGLKPLIIRPRDFGGQFPGDSGDQVPISPISGLGPVSYRQFDVKLNDIPRAKNLDKKVAQAWAFDWRLSGPALRKTEPFKGYVSDVVDASIGAYEVKNFRGQAIRAQYERSAPPLNENRIVIATYDIKLNEWNIAPINQRDNLLKIVEVQADTLKCETINTSTEFIVMKPWSLRRSVFDGETRNGLTYTYVDDVTRDVTDGTITERQIITPDYAVDDVIVIHKMNEPTTVDATARWFEDKNVDSRAWAVEVPGA